MLVTPSSVNALLVIKEKDVRQKVMKRWLERNDEANLLL